MHLLLQSYTSNYKNKHLIYSKDFNYFSLGARPPEQLLEVSDMLEVKFLDRHKTDESESICKDFFHLKSILQHLYLAFSL